MKKLLTFSLLLAGATTISAQQTAKFAHPFADKVPNKAESFKRHVAMMLDIQQRTAPMKTTAFAERVTGESTYEFYSSPVPTIQDSIRYKYSGTNGSKFNFNSMNFDSYFYIGFEASQYPYDWSVMPVMADTVKYWWKDSATAPLAIGELTTATFNTNKKLTSYSDLYYYMGAPVGTELYHYSYDAQGRLKEMLGLNAFGSVVDTSIKVLFYYDAQGRLDIDIVLEYSNGVWDIMATVKFAYDASGNITSVTIDGPTGSGWATMEKYENTFYTDNKLKTAIYSTLGSSSLEPDTKDSFDYASNSAFATLQTTSYWNNGWEAMDQTVKHLDAQGLPDTVFMNWYDDVNQSWIPYGKSHYTYTSYGNPLVNYSTYFNGISWSPENNHYYYYEVYNDNLGIQNTVPQEQMKVYPNPAISEVTVSWSKASGKKATVELMNAAGQSVYTASVSWKHDQKISVQNLAPGMYWLTVRNDAGAVIFRQSVIKQ